MAKAAPVYYTNQRSYLSDKGDFKAHINEYLERFSKGEIVENNFINYINNCFNGTAQDYNNFDENHKGWFLEILTNDIKANINSNNIVYATKLINLGLNCSRLKATIEHLYKTNAQVNSFCNSKGITVDQDPLVKGADYEKDDDYKENIPPNDENMPPEQSHNECNDNSHDVSPLGLGVGGYDLVNL